jgi:membrane associated rhomboid family serine protease
MFFYRLYETFLNLPVGLQSVLLALLFMYILHVFDRYLFRKRLASSYSLKPRQSNRLLSPLLAHTLHGDWRHLSGNSIPFVVLGSLIALPNVQLFWLATLLIMLVASLGTWIIGSKGIHLGASGLITGYFGFLTSRGFFTQDVQSTMIGLLVGLFYFSIFRMVFRRIPGVSNVMHIFGFVGGFVAAYLTPWMIQ